MTVSPGNPGSGSLQTLCKVMGEGLEFEPDLSPKSSHLQLLMVKALGQENLE